MWVYCKVCGRSEARDLLVKISMLEKKIDIRITIKNKSCPQYVKFQKNVIKKVLRRCTPLPEANYTICERVEIENEKNYSVIIVLQSTICNGSPFEKFFHDALSTINSTQASKIRNCYFCSNIFNKTLIQKYLAIFSLWSGVHLIH